MLSSLAPLASPRLPAARSVRLRCGRAFPPSDNVVHETNKSSFHLSDAPRLHSSYSALHIRSVPRFLPIFHAPSASHPFCRFRHCRLPFGLCSRHPAEADFCGSRSPRSTLKEANSSILLTSCCGGSGHASPFECLPRSLLAPYLAVSPQDKSQSSLAL